MTIKNNNINILLVDDDEIDRQAVKRAFIKHKILNNIIEAEDGKEAFDILIGTCKTKEIKTPFIILLDINMPIMGGFDFLKKVRNDSKLRKIIIFMLTTSNADEDKSKAYGLHVNGYLSKNNVGPEFIDLVNLINGFWRVVEIP